MISISHNKTRLSKLCVCVQSYVTDLDCNGKCSNRFVTQRVVAKVKVVGTQLSLKETKREKLEFATEVVINLAHTRHFRLVRFFTVQHNTYTS